MKRHIIMLKLLLKTLCMYMIYTQKETANKHTGENGQAKKNSSERGHVVVQLSC